MKAQKVLLLAIVSILFLSTVLIVSSPPVSAKNTEIRQPVTISLAKRELTFKSYGLLMVNDTFYIYNNMSSSVSCFEYYLPNVYEQKLAYISAMGDNFRDLLIKKVASDESGYSKYIVYFDHLIGPFENYTFTIGFLLADQVTLIENETQTFSAEIITYPTVKTPIEKVQSYIVLPYTGELTTQKPVIMYFLSQGTTYRNTTYNLPSMTLFKLNITYTFTQSPLISYLLVEKVFTFKPAVGFIDVTETHKLKNIGKGDLYGFDTFIPDDAEDIIVKDELGTIQKSTGHFGSLTRVTVTFRNLPIHPNYTYTYTVSYRLPLEKRIKEDGYMYELTLDVSTHIETFVRNYTVVVKIPDGVKVKNYYTTRDNDSFRAKWRGNTMIFEYSNATHWHFGTLHIKYYFTSVPYSDRVIFFSSIIGLLVLGMSVIVRYNIKHERELPPGEEEVIPIELIRDFCETYDNRFGVLLQLEKIEEDRRARKIKKKDYELMKLKLEKEFKALTEKLKPIKAELRKRGSRYEDAIRKLEIYEEERENAKASMDFLERRYRLKKISKSVYEKLMEEQLKKLRSSTEHIDRIIFDLRQLIET